MLTGRSHERAGRADDMAQQAIGMIETRGLVPLVQAADAALKAAHVTLAGWRKVGSGLCTVCVTGDVAAVRSAVDAGAEAGRLVGEVVRVHVIARPHDEVTPLLG
jgi:microcompartment protein CcmL/EutN